MVYYLDIYFQLIKPSICLGVEIPSSLSGWVKSDKELRRCISHDFDSSTIQDVDNTPQENIPVCNSRRVLVEECSQAEGN